MQAAVDVYSRGFRDEVGKFLEWRGVDHTTASFCRAMRWRLARRDYRIWKAAERELAAMAGDA